MKRIYPIAFFAFWLSASSALAQSITPGDVPAAADPSRIRPDERLPKTPEDLPPPPQQPAALPTAPVPQGAENVRFTLCDVRIEGVTAFSQEDFHDVYASELGQEITLDKVYTMAGEITQRYRDEGYFLSLAIVPDQQIENGVVVIRVVEGYIGDVLIEGDEGRNRVLRQYIEALLEKKPLKSDEMESFLLRVNDLPGYRYSGVLLPADNAAPGAVKLSLVVSEKEATGLIGFDNLSSRYLGPHQLSASYNKSFLPLQQTSLFGLTSAPLDRLNYTSLSHSIVLAPDLTLDFTASGSRGRPKYTLELLDIKSDSYFLSSMLNYQWIRQRQMNLSLRLGIDGRNTNSDILNNAPLTRDRIRAVRAGFTFDAYDSWRGYSSFSATFSKGLRAFDASEAGQLTLSRFEADSDFAKGEFSLTRFQGLWGDWSGVLSLAGQVASGPLFSAEEFGYGGSTFGRAFDLSEITGDHGVSTAVELQYGGWREFAPIGLIPYTFYDFGVVWNDDIAQPKQVSGSSAGIGIRAFTENNVNANLSLAFPLSREVSAPLYGQNETGPRFLLQVSRNF